MNFWPLLISMALFVTPTQPPNLYVLQWVSPLPVQLSRVEVTGGRLIQLTTEGDDRSGTIAALAPRACVTIRAEGQTTAGVLVVYARAWDLECDRRYAPIVMR